jgi:hypothetical protein
LGDVVYSTISALGWGVSK